MNEASPSNWSILTYENPSFDFVKRLTCVANAEPYFPHHCLRSPEHCKGKERFTIYNRKSSFALDNFHESLNKQVCDFIIFFTEECDYLVDIKNDKVKELRNPSYPSRDDPGRNCTWSVVAELDRRIMLVCPFNDGSDTRSDDVIAKISDHIFNLNLIILFYF